MEVRCLIGPTWSSPTAGSKRNRPAPASSKVKMSRLSVPKAPSTEITSAALLKCIYIYIYTYVCAHIRLCLYVYIYTYVEQNAWVSPRVSILQAPAVWC